MTPGTASMPPTPTPDLTAQLLTMASGAWVTQMMVVAAELSLADALGEGERSVEELAERTGTHAETLFRLLRALASVGIFAETQPRHFVLTPLAELLRSDHPQSLRQFVRHMGGELYRSWDGLLESVRTGEPAFRRRHGMSLFEWYNDHPDEGAVFAGAMGDNSRRETEAFLASYPFEEIHHLVDVGGCQGQLLQAVLKAHDHLRGTLFDLPAVVSDVSVPPELSARLQVESGDFFAGVPAGADAYLLKHIIHDWDDDACVRILSQIRKAMAPLGRVLILEPVIPPGNDPFPGKLLDLNMLVMTEGGRERTAVEYGQLLERSGFRVSRILPTPGVISVVEAFAA